ncbi:hypothetical protein ETU08_07700 [Apibacter muscae]|nr:hypothetical protein ETU08_07700 [Apibacter muscae]
MSRIRVQFPWQKAYGGQSPWIRSITPYAGSGKGMHVVPEIGEEVIVSFENGNAEKPVSLGAMFNGKGKSGHGGAGNFIKGLQTPTGNKIQFNDKEGSALLTDNGGASMKFDGAGNAVTNAAAMQTLNVGGGGKDSSGETIPPQSVLKMDKDGNIKLDGKTNITLMVGENTLVIDANGLTLTNKDGNKVAITPEGIVQTASVGDISSTAETGDIKLDSSASKITLNASTQIEATAGSTIDLSAPEVNSN